ncbi:AlpA family phage regulatory protein [Pigmentiphaga sp. YJ18]|uniref:helix-turn-helix transcriptional regulator n=1 Tax=Pigmentiphaga sp. YJ18 TaxID=3134907 RepID=UPI00310C9557
MPEKLVYRVADVTRLVGLSKTTIYALLAKGDFPRPVRITDKIVGWRAEDVVVWVRDRPTT